MITVTAAAARQIHHSAREGDCENLALRIAARRKSDGSLDYAMGFAAPEDIDNHVTVEGAEIVIAPFSAELLQGATLDYVELQPGEFSFIFQNPNDPHYLPPKAE